MLLSFVATGEQNGTYIIHGKVPSQIYDGATIRLYRYSLAYEKPEVIDSTIVRDEAFSFKGESVPHPFLAFISVPNRVATRLIIEPGEIDVEIENGKLMGTLSGTPLNDAYNEFVVEPYNKYIRSDTLSDKRMRLRKAGTWTTRDEADYRMAMKTPTALNKEAMEKELEFVEKYILYPDVISSSLYKYYYLTHLLSKRGISAPYDQRVKTLMASIPKEYADRIYAAGETADKKYEEYLSDTTRKPLPPIKDASPEEVSAGKKYTDFSGIGIDDKNVTLSQLIKGDAKLVLLDFWASWCGPCLNEMPVISQLNKEYGPKGLLVIGVSSDTDSGRWKAAMEKYGMTWAQLNSPGNQPRSAGAIYGVKFIPYTILLDANGVIVERGLRGDALKSKIESILK